MKATSITTTSSSACQRLAHLDAVGQRVGRVAAFDDQRPEAVGMLGQDLFRDHVAGEQATDDPGAGDRAAFVVAAPPEPTSGTMEAGR